MFACKNIELPWSAAAGSGVQGLRFAGRPRYGGRHKNGSPFLFRTSRYLHTVAKVTGALSPKQQDFRRSMPLEPPTAP